MMPLATALDGVPAVTALKATESYFISSPDESSAAPAWIRLGLFCTRQLTGCHGQPGSRDFGRRGLSGFSVERCVKGDGLLKLFMRSLKVVGVGSK